MALLLRSSAEVRLREELRRIKKNIGGTVSNKWSIPNKAGGDAIKHIKGGPGSADSTREMKFNGFQKKALAGKPYKSK